MFAGLIYYAWAPVKSWCCRPRLPNPLDIVVEERLRKLEGLAKPVVPPDLLQAQDVSILVSSCFFF